MSNTKNKDGLKVYSFQSAQIPYIKEVLGKPYIMYGEDNLYPMFVTDMYNQSAINRRCINSKVDAIVGQGVYSLSDDGSTSDIVKPNPDETFTDFFEKIALDYVLFGGFAINVIWAKSGLKIAEMYHVDFTSIRSGKLNPVSGKVDKYFISADWSNLRKAPLKEVPAYHSPTLQEIQSKDFESFSQILYVKDYNPAQKFYPIPTYAGSFNDIQLDVSVSEFHISNISNGLTPNLWINFPNGDPGEEIKRKIYDELSASFAGAHNAGRYFLTFSEGSDAKPEVTPISLENDDYYLQLEERITSRILSGHGISSPLLVGLRVGGSGLGSNSDEINVAWEHYTYTVVRPIKKVLLKTTQSLINNTVNPTTITIVPEKIFNTPL